MKKFLFLVAIFISACSGGSNSNSSGNSSTANAIAAPTQVNVVSSHS